jgi:hypothetical protein
VLDEIGAGLPRIVGRCPEVDLGVVPSEDREATLFMSAGEAQLVLPETPGDRDIANRQSRDGTTNAHPGMIPRGA